MAARRRKDRSHGEPLRANPHQHQVPVHQQFPLHHGIHPHDRFLMNSYYVSEFNKFKEAGNYANTQCNYIHAIECYSGALHLLDMIEAGITVRDIAKVYSNRSLMFFKINKFDQALDDGLSSVEIDPTWIKGYWRVSSAMREQKEPTKALKVLVTGYSVIKSDSEQDTKDKADFIKEIATLSTEFKGYEGVQQLYYTCHAPVDVWSKVVLQLARQKLTKVLYHVFLGGSPYHGIAGMATGCDASPVDLKPLLSSMGPSDRNRYGMDLMLTLIRHGARWERLTIKDGDTPLHVALHHGMEIANFEFLKYLFNKHARTREQRSRTDNEGGTILHYAAKQQGKQRQKAVLFLLKENVDPCITDKSGKTAADYITDWVLAGKVRSEMKEYKQDATNQPQTSSATSWSDAVKKKQPRSFENQARQQNVSAPVLQERVRRPYSSNTPTNYGFSEISAELPERVRRPYSSSANSNQYSQHRTNQKAPHNRNDKQRPKSKANAKKQIYQKEELDGYQRGSQLKVCKQYDKALAVFLKCIHENNGTDKELVQNCLQEILNILDSSDYKEISPDVKSLLSASFWDQTMLDLQETNRWRVMFLLLNGGGNNCEFGEGGLAAGCNLLEISITRCLQSKNNKMEKIKIIKALLENGARPNGLAAETESPVKYCLHRVKEDDNYAIITAMIRKEANPEDLIQVPGDGPLHAGLRLCLLCNDKKMDLLHVLLDKYSKTKNNQYLDPTATNTYDDDTLFHIALNEKDEALSLEAVKLLSKNKVNPYLKNKAGKIPITQIKKVDRRYPFLEEAARHHSKKGKKGIKKSKDSSRSNACVEEPAVAQTTNQNIVTKKTKQDKKEKKVPGMDKSELKRKIALLIDEVLPVVKQAKMVPVGKEARIENKRMQNQENTAGTLMKVNNEVEEETDLKEESEIPEANKPDRKFNKKQFEDFESEAEDLQEIDTTVFDNLPWEVECTAKVWKFLRDRHVPEKIKQAVVNKVRLLGEGNWTKSLAKPLSHSSDHHIHLYEVKVTSGGRILWQKAIAFSPKRSVIPEERLAENKQKLGGVEGGRIYADVIRVWDVVLDHDKVAHAIDVIVKSIDRGQECILQKKLKGLKNNSTGQAVRIPNLYQEILSEEIPEVKKQDFFPPASSKETEYHIMKFYSFSSSLVNNILHESNVRVDFPFRVTEKEHAIIHINPRPPCSLLLLGRSGTGKTTCCLYRLWSYFLKYWTEASVDGEPRIPRDFNFRHSRNEELEEVDAETSDDELADEAIAAVEGSADEDSEEENEVVYDHLNQIFITKNRVLCSEVLKNFRDLAHGCSEATHYLSEDQQLPYRFQDAPITGFPYFLNSRQFLLMLDASLPGEPYFARNPDGSLKKDMRGWQYGDSQQPFLDMMDLDEESDDDENDDEEIEEREVEFDPDAEEKVQKKKGTYDVRHEVTYEIFSNTFWTKINKKNLPYHPTLVWMEIRSFLKGSIEALHSEEGKLELEEYQKLGRKRAPNFTGDRKEIYDLFKKYEHMKKQRFYFDEADVVFNIYKRLQDVEMPDWAIHQIYVDETQDFTQAELALLIRCCSNPNAIFLTGDTAQSIMRGVAFRFDDLKSLFHYARNSMKALGKQAAVAVPKKVYQLTHNYRSHAGILELAASVVDLLFFFFPTSFDRLKRDQGLFDGPKPVLLDFCSTSDLALILRGNKRKTSEIEFGAHQVILVANEQAKENLPEELSLALCLTIFEAKGLEFDDVMIYNFFKDSPAKEEWRVVQEHLQDIQNQEQDVASNESNLFELDIDVMNSAEQPRKLAFDPDKHKVLNSELKYLYTAISRARVNVWIFDEDTVNRKPMFLYFKARKLVRVLDAELDLSRQSQFHDVMFVEKSSAEDWEKRGDYFYNNGLWEVAVKCYQTAGNDEKVLKAKANHRVNEAEKMKGTNVQKMCDWYLEAAYDFLQCGMYNEAARCLFNTKAFNLSAQLFEKIGDVAGAAKIYETRLRSYRDASRCHEKRGDYAMAVKVLKQNREYDKAADVIERYEQRKADNDLPQFYEPPRYTLESCCRQAAQQHFQSQAYDKMLAALNRLPNVDDRITFLKSRSLHHEAVEILKGEGRLKDAAEILKATGNLHQAIELCRGEDLPEFLAECHLQLAKQKMKQLRDLNTTKPDIPSMFEISVKTSENVPSVLNCEPENSNIQEVSSASTLDGKADGANHVEINNSKTDETTVSVQSEVECQSTKVTDVDESDVTNSDSKLQTDDASKIIPDVSNKTNTSTSDTKETKYQKYEKKRQLLVDDIKNHAEESLKLLNSKKDSSERFKGDCKFILAKMNRNVSILKEANEHYRRASSDAGQIECFHLNIQITGKAEGSFFEYQLSRLHDFVQVLIKYDGEKGQQKVNSAENFYGLELGASTQTQWREEKFKQARLEVVRKHCLPKAAKWFKLFKEQLMDTEMKTKQCPLFATGRPCTQDDCKHSHHVYRRESILQLVQCFVSMIKLVHSANQWEKLIYRGSAMDVHTLTDGAIRWEFQPCSKLYDLVFPSHCNRRILTENHVVIKELFRLIRQPEVKEEMTSWVLNLRSSIPKENINCDSNVYIKALNVHRLVKENPNVIKQWVKDDETECTKFKKRPIGIWLEKNGEKISFMRRMLDYYNDLHFSGNPIKAIGTCNRCLVFIAKRPWIPLIPSISNTVAIIEHAFTLACAVMARVYRIEVFLPASYLAHIQFQDELCRVHNRRYTFYESIDWIDTVKISEIQGQVRNFVDMMIFGDKFQNFDIIPDAFSSRQEIESGEAERSLILALVMLCNYRNLLGFPNVFNLRGQLVHIQTDQQYPPRLARAVEGLKDVKTLKDVMDVLQKLLTDRDNEYLLACKWSFERHRSRYHRLNYDTIVTERYKDIHLGTLQGLRPLQPIVAQDNRDVSHEETQDLDEEDLEQKALFDFEKKCSIISKIMSTRGNVIQTLIPIISEKGKLAKLIRAQMILEKYPVDEKPQIAPKIDNRTHTHWFVTKMEEKCKLEEIWCGICCESFEITVRPASPTEDETSTQYDLQRESSITETKPTQLEEHILTNVHLIKQECFAKFKKKMINTLVPLFEETDFLYNQNFTDQDVAHDDLEVFYDRVKECRHHFNKTITDVIENLRWGDFDQVHSCLFTYNEKIKELSREKSKQMEETKTKPDMARASAANSNDDVAEEIREEHDDDEEQHQTLEIGIKKNKKGRGGRQKAKAKKRNLRNK